jgi:Transposase, Mutator family
MPGRAFCPAAELAAATFEETLSYNSFPKKHWRCIRANNPIERILRAIRHTRCSALCRIARRPSIWLLRACGTSPESRGRPRDT